MGNKYVNIVTDTTGTYPIGDVYKTIKEASNKQGCCGKTYKLVPVKKAKVRRGK